MAENEYENGNSKKENAGILPEFAKNLPGLNVRGLPDIFPRSSRGLPGRYPVFFQSAGPPLCGLLANNFGRMPAAALRDKNSYVLEPPSEDVNEPESRSGKTAPKSRRADESGWVRGSDCATMATGMHTMLMLHRRRMPADLVRIMLNICAR